MLIFYADILNLKYYLTTYSFYNLNLKPTLNSDMRATLQSKPKRNFRYGTETLLNRKRKEMQTPKLKLTLIAEFKRSIKHQATNATLG